jgi:hypothetical protein
MWQLCLHTIMILNGELLLGKTINSAERTAANRER